MKEKVLSILFVLLMVISWTATAVAQDATPRRAGDKSFVYRNGVWFDTTYDPVEHPVYGVRVGSMAYRWLHDALPQLTHYESLGSRVLFVYDDWAYEVGAAETSPSIVLPPRPADVVIPPQGNAPHLIASGTQPAPLTTNQRQWLVMAAVLAVPILIGSGVWLERWLKRPSA